MRLRIRIAAFKRIGQRGPRRTYSTFVESKCQEHHDMEFIGILWRSLGNYISWPAAWHFRHQTHQTHSLNNEKSNLVGWCWMYLIALWIATQLLPLVLIIFMFSGGTMVDLVWWGSPTPFEVWLHVPMYCIYKLSSSILGIPILDLVHHTTYSQLSVSHPSRGIALGSRYCLYLLKISPIFIFHRKGALSNAKAEMW